jgi:acyl-CoA dehydrogenase family member 9
MDEEEKKLAEELLFSEKKNPSFAKQLFFGRFDSTLVFPYPYPSEEESQNNEAFLKQVTEFSDKNIDPVAIDREARIPKEVIQGLGDLGVLGMTVPKQFSGLGMSQNAYCHVTDRIAERCGSTALFINVQQSIGLKAILLFGTDKQKNEWLPSLAKGEKFAAFSLTEPNAGSDANGVETRAVYDPEKKVYRINGQKQWTTNGSIAHLLTVMAKTEVETKHGKEDRVTAFLVTPDMPGFRVKDRALDKLGMRGTWTANLEFKDMEVPQENVLGPLGGGLKVCLTVLDYGRTTFGSMCTGAARELVRLAVKHARDRYQFKRPLASFPLVKEKIASMCSLLYAMDAATYLTAGLIDSHVEDIMLESAILKVFTSDALWQILYDSMQILGGRCFFTDQPYERMMRDARLNMIGEGSNEVLRAFIGVVGMRDVGVELKETVDAWKNPFADLGNLKGKSGVLLSRLRLPKIPVRSQLLQKQADELAQVIRELSWQVVRLLARHREDIVEKQLQLNRISSVVMAVYVSSAVLSKLDADLQRVDENPQALGHDFAIGTFFIDRQMKMCRRWFKGMKSNSDEAVEKLSDQITGLL